MSIVWKVLIYVSNYPFVSQSKDVHLRGVEGGPLPSALEHSPSLVFKLFVHFFPNCSPFYLLVIWYMFACVSFKISAAHRNGFEVLVQVLRHQITTTH